MAIFFKSRDHTHWILFCCNFMRSFSLQINFSTYQIENYLSGCISSAFLIFELVLHKTNLAYNTLLGINIPS